tara:strand:+ start:500 stop:1060 length:561 start_codon:yes stop_codon:yes gene_type:complete
MALAVNPIVELLQTKDYIYIVDVTGDYNAVTNPTGWGSPNELRSALSAITATVTYPDSTTAALTLTGTDLDNDTIRAYKATSLLKTDGVYAIDVTFQITVAGTPPVITSETVTAHSLRDYDIKCQLAALALGNTDSNDFNEAKLIYDRMIVAFDCAEYVLVEEILTDLEAFFDDCGYSKINCGCGC